jgi:hypothetical protein
MIKLILAPVFWSVFVFCMHNFYVSTTSIRFVPQENTLQITTQVFMDDLEAVLRYNGNDKIELNPSDEQAIIDNTVENYLRKNIIFGNQGKKWIFDFLGKVYKNDLVVAYMELKIDTLSGPLKIKNTLFYELLPYQKNIIHFKVGSKRKSFLAVSSKSEFEIPKHFFSNEAFSK